MNVVVEEFRARHLTKGSEYLRAAPTVVEASQVVKKYGRGHHAVLALDGVSLTARQGEFVALVGPSGCGKSTLLRILAGIDAVSSGTVLVEGQPVKGIDQRLAYLPQDDLLLPWKTLLDNVALPLMLEGSRKSAAREKAKSLFRTFGLDGFERSYPSALSGGMRQRAALLRTFLTDCRIVLLDEPFGSLDAITRHEMQRWLLEVWSSWQWTVLLVTHDVDEAIYLADRLCVLSPRPARISNELDIPLERPRNYEETVTSAAFADLKRQVLRSLDSGSLVRR